MKMSNSDNTSQNITFIYCIFFFILTSFDLMSSSREIKYLK